MRADRPRQPPVWDVPVTGLADRRAAFVGTFPQWPAAWPWIGREQQHECLYAIWVLGNDYRTRTAYHGAYPHGYLARLMALFPDADPDRTLHAFSGALPPGPYVRCDCVQPAELHGNVYDLAQLTTTPFSLVLADPPYTPTDAARYGTPPVDRRRALDAIAAVTVPGGHLAWLDLQWPMHQKTVWRTVGRIYVQRSTNHRVRVCTLFERQ